MTHLMGELLGIFEKWCPAGFEHETTESRLMRALLNANACVADLQRVIAGKAPIRPLSSYPLEDLALPRIKAVFRPQAPWENDGTRYLEGTQHEFDATWAVLCSSPKDLRRFRFNDYATDRLAEFYHLTAGHDGPFEVDVDAEAWRSFWQAHGVTEYADDYFVQPIVTEDKLAAMRRRYGLERVRSAPRPSALFGGPGGGG